MSEPLDSRQLRAFVTLANTGSFTRTGKDLFLTQSAISHAIKARLHPGQKIVAIVDAPVRPVKGELDAQLANQVVALGLALLDGGPGTVKPVLLFCPGEGHEVAAAVG